MTMLLNPMLDGLEVARRAASEAVHPDDEVMMDDHDDHWEFEFVPQGDGFGGGASLGCKGRSSGLRVVRGQ